MIANELMVGNVVSGYGEDLILTCIGSGGVSGNFIVDGKCQLKFTHPSLKPIMLTKDWLINFGFNWADDNNEFLELKPFRTFKFHSDYSNDFSTVAFRINDTEKEINFVHQLQNLYFALTGTELKTKK